MTDLEKLASASAITEWIDVHDQRLLAITGFSEATQAMGQAIRRPLQASSLETANVLGICIARLLVPNPTQHGRIHVHSDVERGYVSSTVTVKMEFDSFAGAATALPLVPENKVVKNPDITGWAAIGMTDTIGLAVFTECIADPLVGHGEVVASIQALMPAVFERLHAR